MSAPKLSITVLLVFATCCAVAPLCGRAEPLEPPPDAPPAGGSDTMPEGPPPGADQPTAPEGPVAAGETVRYEVEVRSQGSEDLNGWRLGVAAVGAPARYVGRTGRGQAVGEARVPRLAPGETATVSVEVTAPAEAREWMLVFDARDRDGKRAAALGSPALQVPLSTVEPEASAEPSESPAT